MIDETSSAAWSYQTEHGHPPSSMNALEEMQSIANELLTEAQVKQKVCTAVSREIVQWVSLYGLRATHANYGLDVWQQRLPMNFPLSVLWLVGCWVRTF